MGRKFKGLIKSSFLAINAKGGESISEREIGLHLFLIDFGGWIAQHK
jgi:hypothetical protein